MRRFDEGGIRMDAVIGFVAGVLIAYVVVVYGFGELPFQRGYEYLSTIIAGAVGGAWYHIRRVL